MACSGMPGTWQSDEELYNEYITKPAVLDLMITLHQVRGQIINECKQHEEILDAKTQEILTLEEKAKQATLNHQHELQRLEKHLSAKDNEIHRLIGENQAGQQALLDIYNTKKGLQAHNDEYRTATIPTLQGTLSACNAEINRLQALVKDHETRQRHSDSYITNLKSHVNTITQNFDAQLKFAKQSHARDIGIAKKLSSVVQARLQARELTVSAYEATIEEMQRRFTAKEEELTQLTDSNTTLNGQLSVALTRKVQVEHKLSQKNNELSVMSQEKRIAEEVVSFYENVLSKEHEREISNLRVRLDMCTSHCSSMEEEYESLTKDYERTKRERDDFGDSNEELYEQVAQLEAEVERLVQEKGDLQTEAQGWDRIEEEDVEEAKEDEMKRDDGIADMLNEDAERGTRVIVDEECELSETEESDFEAIEFSEDEEDEETSNGGENDREGDGR